MARRVGCTSMQKLHLNPMGALLTGLSCSQKKNDKKKRSFYFIIFFLHLFKMYLKMICNKDVYFKLYYLAF